jgi:hypothetical protein
MSMPNRMPSKPSPEQLAAYVDGELDSAEAARVEAWLADNPDDAAEVEADRHLLHLWRETQPADPRPEAWARTLDGIAKGAPPHGPGGFNGRRWRVGFVAALFAAAAVLAGLLLARPWLFPPPPAPPGGGEERAHKEPEDEGDEPYPVVTAGEVNIISMDAGDADAVVLGQPLMGEIEFARPADIEVLDVQPHEEDGSMPRLEPGPVPMIVHSDGDEDNEDP